MIYDYNDKIRYCTVEIEIKMENTYNDTIITMTSCVYEKQSRITVLFIMNTTISTTRKYDNNYPPLQITLDEINKLAQIIYYLISYFSLTAMTMMNYKTTIIFIITYHLKKKGSIQQTKKRDNV